MARNLLVRGGRIVSPDGIYMSDVLVREGIIAALGAELDTKDGEVIDATDKLIFPGVIDEHVHCREPGLVYKDNFANGTKAAAAGGVTTILEMPNTLPPVDSVAVFNEKKELLEPKAYVDFGLYGVIHNSNADAFEDIVAAGAVGFKVFLGPTTGGIPPPDDGSLLKVMEKSAANNVTIAFHAENQSLVNSKSEEVRKTGRTDPQAHTDARPPVCEEEAIQRIALLAKVTGGRALVLHMSAKQGVQALEAAASQEIAISGETCPQYLMLSEDDYQKYGTLMKVNPPIRSRDHADYLWGALKRGSLVAVSSDHAPHSAEEKKGDIWKCASGVIGTQTLFPLMLDSALRGRIQLHALARILSSNPAKTFGLYPRKGAIQVGSDADLVIVDPSGTDEIQESKLYAAYPITPFLGWTLKGRLEKTILRGNIVSSNGVPEGPRGRFIRPSIRTPGE